MNSVIQQLYMIPGIPEAVLSVDEENIEEERYADIFSHTMKNNIIPEFTDRG